MEKEQRFYEHTLFVWALLFVMPPIGILTLWIIQFYNIYLRVTLSILFGLLFLNYLGMEASFLRAVILVVIINLLWLRNQYLTKHSNIAILKYQELLNQFEIRDLIKKFIIEYNAPTGSYDIIKQFEEEIIKDYPISSNKLTITNEEEIYIHAIFKRLSEPIQKNEVAQDVMNDHKTNFMMFIKFMLKKFDLGTEKLAVYYVWTLMKQLSIDYFSDEFINHHINLFRGLEINELVFKYISHESLSQEINSKDRVMLTYYLMKKGEYKGDFINSFNKLDQEINKQLKIKKEKEFIKSLYK